MDSRSNGVKVQRGALQLGVFGENEFYSGESKASTRRGCWEASVAWNMRIW